VDPMLIVVGLWLALLGLYDMFRTLFLPAGKGLISRWVALGVWRCTRLASANRAPVLSFAGPLAFVATVLTWGLLFSFGFALVYWAYMPEGFTYSPGLLPAENAGLLDALYLSIVAMATLGLGDITPVEEWLRILLPVQALVGFLLWTATISWLLSIHPDIASHQAFAREVSLLRESEIAAALDVTALNNADATVRVLDRLTSGIIGIKGDLLQFPITYHFYTDDRQASLPAVLPYVLDLAGRASGPDRPDEVRLQALRLRGALGDLADIIAERFLLMTPEPIEDVLRCYARDHTPAGTPEDGS
jgi:hypothetical protein